MRGVRTRTSTAGGGRPRSPWVSPVTGPGPTPSGPPPPDGAIEEVERVARVVLDRRLRTWPALARRADDLMQELRLEGWLALERFDSSREVPLGAFLQRRLGFALVDALRRDSGQGAGAYLGSAVRRGAVPDAFRGAATSLEATNHEGQRLHDPADGRPGVEEEIDARDEVRALVARDPVGGAIALAHAAGETLRAIGERAGLSESRACQLEARFVAAARGLRSFPRKRPVALARAAAKATTWEPPAPPRRPKPPVCDCRPGGHRLLCPARRRSCGCGRRGRHRRGCARVVVLRAAAPLRPCGCAGRGRHRLMCVEGAARARAS